MSAAASRAIDWAERGLVPDVVIRSGIRRLLKQRLKEIRADETEHHAAAMSEFIAMMDRSTLAPVPHKANEQHYEVPAEFFGAALGPNRKYSSCFWERGTKTLAAAEVAALKATCERAGLADGQSILELGCGWGSLTLFMAGRYRKARITAVSNSSSQREYITGEAQRRGLSNVQVITRDMNEFTTDERYDRIVSVEMFEHMRNYRRLFERLHDWLIPGGRFFMHIFVHRAVPYEFVDQGAGDWMSRHFFAGGIMPGSDLPLAFQDHLHLVERWHWSGTHYARTANAWLANIDARRADILPVLARTYGAGAAEQWFHRWRMFFMACAELFAYRGGREWLVAHYLFERPGQVPG